MKAALLESVGKLTIIETEPPLIKNPSELLIKVEATGICGSELHAFKGTHPFRKAPVILGHEVAGRVIEVGEQVQTAAPGDRVLVEPQWTCGRCKWCQTDNYHLCVAKTMMGTTGWSGSFGAIVAAPAERVYQLPDDVSFVQGTLVEPLAVGVRAARRANIQPGESAAIIGTGPIGMMVSAAAGLRGASKIIAVDRQPHCLETVQHSFGASHGILANEKPLAEQVLALNNGVSVDVVFLTVGIPALMPEALKMVNKHGRIVLVALFDGPLEFDSFSIINNELTVIGSMVYNAEDFQTALDLIASGQIPAEAMVSHVLPVEKVQHGFDLATSKKDQAIKVVLEF